MPIPQTFECFGLVLHGFDWPETQRRLDDAIQHRSPLWIVTANAEILLEAHRNPRYWEVVRQAHLRLIDGSGPQIMGWLKGASVSRLSGVDIAEALLARAEREGWTVVFMGSEEGIADRAARVMRGKYSELRIVAEYGGRVAADGSGDEEHERARQRLRDLRPDVLLLAWSHPKPDMWLGRYLSEFPDLKVAIGVGGTLDYWAGKAKRAPRVFQALGLEWLWRLFREPKRWRRIVDAVIIFPWKVLKNWMK